MVHIVCISGKRNTGKSTLANALKLKLNVDHNVAVFTIAYALKKAFCKEHNLNEEQFTNDRKYKEEHRLELREYDKKIKLTHGDTYWIDCLCKTIINTNYDIIIISDMRRKYEYAVLTKVCSVNSFKLIFVRIEINNDLRMSYGWIFDEKIDNDIFECDLDDFNGNQWDVLYSSENINHLISKITY